MNKLSFKFLLITLCFVFTVNSAFAWDAVGHKLSTYIAWEQMTPETRAKVIKILLDAPEDSDLSVHYDAFNSRSRAIKQRELFMYASIWSDVIRNRKFDVRYKNYHQGNWHYADIFWKQEDGKALVLKDFPEESGKAIYKLADFEKILKGSSYKNEEKAIALAWFLHIGGDIHNPVHNASRVTKKSPKGDQGGNRFVLQKRTKNQRRINLHGYWDSVIGNVKPRKNDACDSDYLAPIARNLMKKYPYEKMQNRLKLSEYKKWNAEGFDLLNKAVYQGITRNQMPSIQYKKRAYKIASERIALAGYRLGESLNVFFSENNKASVKAKTKQDNGKDADLQNAMAIWEKVKSVINNRKQFKFIRVDIKDKTIILNGIISSTKLKKAAVEAVKKLEGVGDVIDNLKVDESLSPQTAKTECKIIRKVLYPVSKHRTDEQKMRIALLDICPPKKGMVARPMMSIVVDGGIKVYEYDVSKVFENVAEARKYAKDNEITDVSF